LSAELVADHGLTISDYACLLHLSRADGGRMRRVDLAEKLGLTASGVTRLLDGLEVGGLVRRASCATDRRVVYAELTDEGRARFEAAAESHVVDIRTFFEERFSDEEIEQLVTLLGRLPEATEVSGEDCKA
jgi:DNA-binding MarR family transcriptional regulator